jgi:hypothetical protein
MSDGEVDVRVNFKNATKPLLYYLYETNRHKGIRDNILTKYFNF